MGRRSGDEIIGRNVFEAFPSPEDSPSYQLLRRSLDRVIETGERDHIAVIPYDTSQPGEPPNMRYWSATHTPLSGADGELLYILQHTVDISELQRLRERDARGLIAEAGVLHRAHEVQAAKEAIAAESEFLRDMFKQAPGFMGILAGPAHTFILANEAYRQLVGGRAMVGRTVAEVLPEVVGQGFIDLLDRVYRTGEPYVGNGVPVDLVQPDGTEKRFVDFVYQPIFDDEGAVSGIFVQGNDVTDKIEADRLRMLQQRELGHRLKNQLAMVHAIASQTLRSATSVESAAHAISARLRALASTHESLISGEGDGTTVGEIVGKMLEVHQGALGRRFRVRGPDMPIASRPALSLSLILHELSTNAVKYGALSNETGIVDLAWEAAKGDAGLFRMIWREEGGPPVSEPTKAGTGTRLIKAGLSGTRESHVELRYPESGVVCKVTAELGSVTREEQ